MRRGTADRAHFHRAYSRPPVERHMILVGYQRSIRQICRSPYIETTISLPFVGMIGIAADRCHYWYRECRSLICEMVRKYLHPRNRAKRCATIELTLRGQKGPLLPYRSFAARRYHVLFCSLKSFDGNGSDAAKFRSLIVLLTREVHAWQYAAGGFQPSPSRDRRYWRVQSVPSSLQRWARPLAADRALVHRAARRLGHPASIPRAIMSRSPEALAFGSRRHFIPAALSLPLCGCLLNRSRDCSRSRVPPRFSRRRYADAPAAASFSRLLRRDLAGYRSGERNWKLASFCRETH